ncbi:MAG: FG-GAP-like repeat-containing protein, partial [Acidobacteriaceae bacterium]
MIGTQRRRTSRTAVLAAGFFVVTNIGLIHLACAQATGAVDSGSPVRPTAPASFLAAPSIALGYAPAAMAGGDLTASGHTDLVATDSTTGEVVVYLSDGHGGFAAPARYAAVANPDAVAIADIDGDGKADVIVASATTGTIAVLPGHGNGTLGSARSFAVGFNAGSLTAGDLTGNGHVDVAVAGLSTRAVAVLANDGKGNLAKPDLLGAAQVPTGLAVGDFNHDGKPDIAVAQADGSVEIFLGQGGGQFRASADVRGVTGPITSISAGDFNRDGNIDLAVTAANGNVVAILLGNGDGTFATPVTYAVGKTPVRVFAVDTDGDGIPDLIVVNRGSNTFSVLKGAGDGSFEPARHFVAGNGPEALAAGEFYGSGHADLAVLNSTGQTMSVAAANGDGTFYAARSYTVGEQPAAVAAGDVNGDGRPDLVVAKSCAAQPSCSTNGSAQVLLGQADGTYQIGASYALGAGPETIALIDVNGDKHPDLVAANRVDKTLTVRLGLGDGTFGQAMTISLAGAPRAMAAGNFHDKGMTDLAVAEDCGSTNCSDRGQVEILRGAGDGNFQTAGLYPAGYATVGLAVGSLDGSGKADIVVANRCGASADCSTGGAATVLLGDGAGNFKAGKSFGLGANPAAIALADLTGSGVQDAVVTRGSDNAVVIFSGKGDGTFAAGVAYRVGSGPGALAIADFNGDGKPDVAVANGGDATVSVLFGQGDGTLQPAFALSVSGNPSSLAAIGGAATSHASLATTNGSTGSPASAQSSITVISNLNETPALTGGPTPNISVTWTSGSSSPSQVNESVSFTATVTGSSAGGPPTGGSVEFFGDGTAISDCGGSSGMTVTAGSGDASTAVCVTSVLTASASGHAITAQYLGAYDTVYDDSKPSASITQVVTPLAPKIDLTTVSPSPASPQSVNTAVTFTATLSGVTFTPTTPTGTVEFQADGTTISSCSTQALSPSGSKYQAQCTTSSLPATPSPHSIVAVFNRNNADTNYKQAAAASISYTIKAATPTLSLTPTPGDSERVNTSVTFTAQLSGSFPAAVPPDGTVSFKINGAASASCPAVTVNANGSASCTTSSLVAPSDKVEATYSGDSNYVVAGTATAFETITQATPVVTIQQPSPAPVVNQQVTLTAQVAATGAGTASAVAPTGSVTFAPAGTTCTSPVGLTGNPGTAPCSYTFKQASTSGITIKASYSGDADYSAASATVSQVVTAASTTVGLTPTPASPAVNAKVSFQATVTPQYTGTTVPTGSVVITDTTTSTQICTQTLTGGVVPACVYTFTTSGTHNIEATYTSGDSNFTAPSQPTAVAVNVGTGTTSVALTSSSDKWTVNQGVTFTATINAGGTMSGLAGSMVFFDQTTSATLCTASVAGNGTVPCKMTQGFTMAGLNSVVAEFTSSNHNFTSVNSAALAQTVNQDATTTGTPTGSPSPSAAGQAVQFNVTVTPTFTGSVNPSGTVTVSANLGGAITQCQFTLPGTSCSMTLTQAGKYSVTATYAGDTNFSGSSTVSAATQTVGPENEAIVIAGPYSCSPTATPSAANGDTGCCLPGLVNKACTGYATLLTQAPTVNQQVYFSATLKPTNPGSTVPIGPLLFNSR